jgi:hypothetical protein
MSNANECLTGMVDHEFVMSANLRTHSSSYTIHARHRSGVLLGLLRPTSALLSRCARCLEFSEHGHARLFACSSKCFFPYALIPQTLRDAICFCNDRRGLASFPAFVTYPVCLFSPTGRYKMEEAGAPSSCNNPL